MPTVTDANGNAANIVRAIDAGNGVVYVIDSVLLPPADDSTAASAPVAEGASALDVFDALDGDGDWLVTEAELREAAEYRGIQLTEEQVAAFLAADADGDGVDVNEYHHLVYLDDTVYGDIGVSLNRVTRPLTNGVKKFVIWTWEKVGDFCVHNFGSEGVEWGLACNS